MLNLSFGLKLYKSHTCFGICRFEGGVDIQKDELIQLHAFLFQLRTHLENMVENNNPQAFLPYVKLDVHPQQVHKSKDEHKLAVFELSKGIADLLRDDDCSISQRIYDGLEGMCNRFRKQND